MRRVLLIGLLTSLCATGFVAAAAMSSPAAVAHNHGCHGAHTCPSDHHTYVWFNGGTGWDCAHEGEKEVGPADTTRIDWDGRTYYCHAAGTAPPTTTTAPTTTAATTSAATPPACEFSVSPLVWTSQPGRVTFYPYARATSPATLDHMTLAYGDAKSETLSTVPTSVDHTYASGGTYGVQLTCVDSRGASSVATATVQVPATTTTVAVTTVVPPATTVATTTAQTTPAVIIPPASSKPKPKPKCKPGQHSTKKRPCRK